MTLYFFCDSWFLDSAQVYSPIIFVQLMSSIIFVATTAFLLDSVFWNEFIKM